MPTQQPTVIVYIDGLNLESYARATFTMINRVDVYALAKTLNPKHAVVAVKYFTAITRNLDGNPESSIGQRIYLDRIVASNPGVSVSLGKIRIDTRIYPLAPRQKDSKGHYLKTKVYKFEEKETDVRIATMMVADASENLADRYLLISSDSDFKPLIETLVNRLKCDAVQLSVKAISLRQIQLCQLAT
jgi:hypothetical protein